MTGGREDWFPTSVWGFELPDPEPLIFPSWLQHGVEPNLSDGDRVCISFNIGLKWIAS